MTRGRHSNVAHLVADSVDDARQQWVDVFSRDRADLGPGHAATRVDEDIDRYGTQAAPRSAVLQAAGRHAAIMQAAALAATQQRPEHQPPPSLPDGFDIPR
jgi:hypothetical protein